MMMGDPSMMGAMQGMYDMGMQNMGMDPGMMGNMGMDPGMMGNMGMDPGMMGNMGMDPGMMGNMGMDPGQMYGNEFMNPGENMMPGQNNQMYGNEFMNPGENMMPGENNMPGENEFFEEEENAGFPKEWGGTIYYDQGSYDAARFYNGVYYINYGDYIAAQGGGGGGGGYEAATAGNDVVYSAGSSSMIGMKPSTPYELLGGDDTAGYINVEVGGMMMDDFIKGNGGNDVIWGGSGSDWLKGGNGSDTLYGNAGNDVLVGGDDTDIIWGGSGTDALVGGNASDSDMIMAGSPSFNATPDAAQDTFVFIEGQGGVNTNFADHIVDWTDGTDKIAYSQDGGTTYMTNPFASDALNIQFDAGENMSAIFKSDYSEYIFVVNGDVRTTLTDDDVTTVVT